MIALGVPKWLALALARGSSYPSAWSGLRQRHVRRRERRELLRLLDQDPHLLRDIGLSREDILDELSDH